MFVRRKKNRSGTTSVVVVDKQGGKFKELHTVGVSCHETEIDRLCLEGREWIKSHLGIRELDFDGSESKDREREAAEEMLSNVDSIFLTSSLWGWPKKASLNISEIERPMGDLG